MPSEHRLLSGGAAAAEHLENRFESDESLRAAAIDFLAGGLEAGEPAVAIATAAYHALLATALGERGFTSASHEVLTLDAEGTFAEFMVGDQPDPQRFRLVVGGALRTAALRSPSGRVRAYGELGHCMWKQGKRKAARLIEELWNELSRELGHALVFMHKVGRSDPHAREQACAVCSRPVDAELDEDAGRETIVRPIRASSEELAARTAELAEERARVEAAERRARDVAADAAVRFAADRRASHAFADAMGDLPQLLAAVVDQVTPAYADGAAVLLVNHSAELELAAVRHRDPAATSSVRDLFGGDGMRVGEGVAGRVAATGEAVCLTRAEVARSFKTLVQAESVVVVPLAAHRTIVGALCALRQSSGFSVADCELLDDLAARAAMAIECHRLSADNEEGRRRAELLYDLARAVIAAERPEEVFTAALDAIARALGTPRSAVLAYDRDGVMRFRAWRGLSDEYRRAVEGHSPWARDERSPRAFFVSDVRADPLLVRFLPALEREGISALGFIPLVAGGTLLGKFMVYFDAARDTPPPQVALAVAIANHAAAALARCMATQNLEETLRFSEMLTGILGHELRNPLHAIMTSAQLAKRRTEDERLTKPIGRILSSGGRMARMIEQILDFARVRVGSGIKLEPRPCELTSLIRQVIEEIEGANAGRSIALAANGDTNGTWDGDRLTQVFSNLVANALQHGLPEGSVEVRVDGAESGGVKIVVHNLGTIPPEMLPTVFEPMSGGNQRSDRPHGVGLGLFITSEIVRAHGGRIEVDSTEALGTTFVVALPRVTGGK